MKNLQGRLEAHEKLLLEEEDKLSMAQKATERLKWQIAFIKDLIAEEEDVAGKADKAAASKAVADTNHHVLLSVGGNTPDWVRKVLESNGAAMRVKDIVDKVAASGMAGKDVASDADEFKRLGDNVSSALNRKASNSPFVKVGRGLFDLKSRA